MGATKEMYNSIQDAVAAGAVIPIEKKRSLFNIRQDHLSLLAIIEENDGELTDDLQGSLRLNESEFKEKVISYGFVVKKYEAEAEIIANEIKRLQVLKQKADRKAELFCKLIDEGMRQYGHEKIESELLKISYRKSTPVELSETFADDILKYCEVDFRIKPEMEIAATEAGISGYMLNCFNINIDPSKKRIGDMLKEGIIIYGASMPEKKNLQIK